jgi:AraC-like DNA-binding protein
MHRLFEALRDGHATSVPLSILLVSAFLNAYMILFVYLTWRRITRAEKKLQAELSAEAGAHFVWLKVLAGGLAFLLGFAALMWVVVLSTRTYTVTMEYARCTVRCLVIQSVAIAAFLKPVALTTGLTDLRIRQCNAHIDETAAADLMVRLEECMNKEKPYRRSGLRLADLAAELAVPGYVLSRLINEHLKMNFFDFVNQYRAEEAKALLREAGSDRYTLLAIANEAGFSSKASFNRGFKKHANMTPSEYRQLVMEGR